LIFSPDSPAVMSEVLQKTEAALAEAQERIACLEARIAELEAAPDQQPAEAPEMCWMQGRDRFVEFLREAPKKQRARAVSNLAIELGLEVADVADMMKVALEPVQDEPKPKRKRRTKADKARERAMVQDIVDGMAGDSCVVAMIHREVADAIAADPSASDQQLAKRFGVAPRTVTFVRENGAPTTCSAAAADLYDDDGLPPIRFPKREQDEEAAR
jgi:hypothetical protein